MGGEATIAQIKNEVLGNDANVDLIYDPKTGDIYVPMPDGGAEPTGFNVGDEF
jgi:hypothetical protein